MSSTKFIFEPKPMFRFDSSESIDEPEWSGKKKVNDWRPFWEVIPQAELNVPTIDQLNREHAVELDNVYKKGFEEGKKSGLKQTEAYAKELSDSIASLSRLRDVIFAETEKSIVDLSLHLASQLVSADTEKSRAFTTEMVGHAIRMLREAEWIRLRVAPEFASTLYAYYPNLAERDSNVTIAPDDEMRPGGIVAESNLGRIDATLKSRLAELEKQVRKLLPNA